MRQAPKAARRNYALSALISRRAVSEARKARPQGAGAVTSVIVAHQMAQAQTSQAAVAEMLLEQDLDRAAEAVLDLLSFTTDAVELDRMVASVDIDAEFERLVESLVTDAGRAAESVAVATRRDVYWTRFVNPPCCARCAILAGRRYRWSDGFERHPGCDCSMLATGEQSPYVLSPDELIETGQVRGLSKADMQALADGANLNQVVNVRSKKAGLLEAGHALRRGGRPTPAGIYRMASSRDDALSLLARYGYIQ